jgi:hypothetical protein
MSSPVTYDFPTWVGMFPEFENVSPLMGQAYFNIATATIIANNVSNPAACDGNLPTLIYLATSHVAWLMSPKDGTGLPTSDPSRAPASQLVGRISSAAEGSVNVQTEYPLDGTSSAQEKYLAQTKYGVALWAAMAPYRTARYAARPTFVFGGRFGYPLGPRANWPFGNW